MHRIVFPDPHFTTPEGIVAIGGDLKPDTLQTAYTQGIFPWPHRGLPLLWFCPPERAVLEFADLHIPESLAKARRKTTLTFTIDKAFDQVIAACQKISRPEQGGTWITPAMLKGYNALHHQGFAHSVEVWDGEELVGGLYGVSFNGVYSGESMFHRVSNASKLALLFLIDHLQERGLDFIDIQQLTPHMEALGAKLIPRDIFLDRWEVTQERGLVLFDPVLPPPPKPRRTLWKRSS